MNDTSHSPGNRELPANDVSVHAAEPVGVWRTCQTYDDYAHCRDRPIAEPGQRATGHRGRRAGISGCLIVRNESKNLAACLESIRDRVDEIVVVDTGSTDGTQDIARAYGARVIQSRWNDSFAEARNVARDHARGEWILAIDADEVLLPSSGDYLDQLVRDDSVCAYYVLFRRRTRLTRNWQLKLYRRLTALRHRSVIHEGITPGQLRAASGKHIGRCMLRFDHYGYDGDLTAKHERNLPLLVRALQSEPDEIDKVYIWGHLGDVYAALGDPESAERAWRRGVAILGRYSRHHPAHCSVHLALLTHLVSTGVDAKSLLKETERFFPGNLQTTWIKGHWLISRGRFSDARVEFERLTQSGGADNLDKWVAYDRRLFDELPCRMIAFCRDRQDTGETRPDACERPVRVN